MCDQHCAAGEASVAVTRGVKLEDVGKLEEAPQVLKSNFGLDELQQLPTKFKDISEDIFWLGKVNGKKLLMLSAKATIFKFSDVNLYSSRRSLEYIFRKWRFMK
ncbi:hypothetical protein Tco_1498376, partial [Tanacetum coccineum]